MREDVTMLRRLSLAGGMQNIIPACPNPSAGLANLSY